MSLSMTFATPTPMRLPMTVADPFEGTVVGQLYKDAIADASVGDVLKCVNATSGDDYFIQDKLYPVVLGKDIMTKGEVVIVDEEGIEVPRNTTMIKDLFVKQPSFAGEVADAIFMDEVVPTPTPDPDLVKWAIRGLESEYADLNETYDSFVRSKAELNKFDSMEYGVWEHMSREERAELLLAKHEGKVIQWYSADMWGNSWNTLNGEFTFRDHVSYRVAPEALASHDAEMKAIREELDTVVDKLRELRGEDDDVWSCDW